MAQEDSNMVRFATIGSNTITDKFLQAAQAVEGFSLVGVYSRTESRARAYAQEKKAKKWYSSMETLCADAQIDAVYVASPNAFHKQQCIQLMNAGKHVICEKPIAPCAQDYIEMLDCARRNRVVLCEAMRPAYSMGIPQVKKLLPEIGTVRRATLQFCQYSSRYDKFRAGIVENAFKPELCNGALMDIGVYCVHVMQKLFGVPEHIAAQALFLKGGIDGQGTILASYPQMQCEVIYSKITQAVTPSQIQGEEGCILLDAVSATSSITVIPRNGQRRVIQVPGAERDMEFEVKAFLNQIREGADVYQQQGTLNTLRIMDRARNLTGIDFKPRP